MKDFKGFAISVAHGAGDLLMKNYGRMQKLEWTAKQHFRTEVDKQSDELIRKKIREQYPEHGIYSEENEGVDKDSEYSWVIDPLDGTIPYTFGITDHFSVCIALVKRKTPILGIIYAPKREEFYLAEQGKGAFCNGSPIRVSSEENLSHVIMGLDSGKETKRFERTLIVPFLKKALSPDGITCPLCSGCASVPLCLVASGKLHAYMALSLEPWDMAAAVIINREAGGKVTTTNGKEWELGDESILVANPNLHTKLIRFFKND